MPRSSRRTLAAVIAALGLLRPAAASASVETHAHLFMEEALTWLFSGDFFGPLKARTWEDKLSSQANPETLEKSGLKLVVASLYANPFTNLSLRESVRRQLALANRFVAENKGWVLARSAREARAALKEGKRVLVLSLEGAGGVIEDERDLKEFVDEGGIRIVTLLHLTDDELGGVALLKGLPMLASPLSVIRALIKGTRDDDGHRVNDKGLSEAGRKLALELTRRRVWIDLAHASDRSLDELVPLVRGAGQPLLHTHTVLRRFHGAERGITGEQLQAVRESKGIVGVMPAFDMLNDTKGAGGAAVEGFEALRTQMREIGLVIGERSVVLGSDYNGGVRHLPPAPPALPEGLWNLGQAGGLWKALGKNDASVERFLEAWEKVSR